MKKPFFLYLMALSLICICLPTKAQIQISPYLMSQNGWMPYQLGGGTTPHDSLTCPGLTAQFGIDTISCKLYGNIDSLWSDISVSNVKLVRYGGTAADQNKPNLEHYLDFVDSVRVHGMEPILQIPVNYGESGLGGTEEYDTLFAKEVVNHINGFPNSRNVKYWSIGNEPDLETPSGYNYGAHTDAILIANYIKDFSKAMRRAVPSVPIKIIGPELANWKCEPSYTKKKLVDSLVIPGQRCDITGMDAVTGKPWIDYFSYHFYSGIDGNTTTVHRDTIINKLHKQYGFKESLEYLNIRLNTANATHSRTTNPIRIGITEANVNTQSITGDPLNGVKANSFIAGQYWLDIANIAAENKVAFITYWSAVEGSMGYMKSDSTKKPTYYHFKMGDNYQGDYLFTADNNPKVKAFASRSDYIGYTVTIMNQNIDTLYSSYTVSFDSTASTGTFKVNFDAGLTGITYSGTIKGESTVQLQFDLAGRIKRKCVYDLYGNANANLPPTCTDYCIGSTDAYLKDHPDDDGGEPSTIHPYLLTFSEDIWIRNQEESQISSSPPLYANEFSHQNPIWTNDIDSVPWIYAKVRNRGCDTVTGKLHLYYTRGSLGDKWTTASTGPGIHQSWIEIGDTLGQTVVLAQSENGTYAFKWDSISVQPSPTTSDFNFCILARFVAGSDPMYQEHSDTAAGWNAQLNNNIAQKNVILVDTTFFGNMQCIQVTNLQTDEGVATIQFVAKDRNGNNFIHNGGKVFVDLGEDLWELWDDGGLVASGVRAVSASTIIEIVTEDAYIGNITLDGETLLPMCFDFLYNPGAPGSTYEFDVREFLDSVFTGAERYILTYPDCPQVDAGNKQEVNNGCEFELEASPEVDGSYTWIIYECPGAPDNEGDIVGTLRRQPLTATYTTIYQVTLRLDNGCYSTDFVLVEVGEGECGHAPLIAHNMLENQKNERSQLLNCVPNPATDRTRFNYVLERNATAEIRLLSPVGNVLNTFQLSQNSESLEVDCSSYNNGIYFYSLIVNGINVQTKKLVISK